jgi:glycosyltransferase involved in cell wall biosynthesis
VVAHTFEGHVLEGYFSRARSRAFIEVERRLARRSDALIAVSSAIRDELLALGIGEPEQWHVIPVGLDLTELLAGPQERSRARTALHLPQEGRAIGIVGRLVPVKDHETFFRAAARLLAQDPELLVVVAGDGPDAARVREAADRIVGAGRVRFLGWVHDLRALYGALDVVVSTSRHEGTPAALMEAGAASLPVVATDVGGVADVVDDGTTGVLAPAGDDAAIAAVAASLLADPDRARVLGAAARDHVAGRFSSERLAADLVQLYDELLARRRYRVPGDGER